MLLRVPGIGPKSARRIWRARKQAALGLDELKRMAKTQRLIRKLTSQSQLNHMERLRTGECSVEAGILFGEILNSLNRIGGHAINIAEAATVPQNLE